MKKNRKQLFVKYLPIVSLSLTSCVSMMTDSDIDESRNPNIIFILADDLGYADISCMGQTKFSTPNIDRFS